MVELSSNAQRALAAHRPRLRGLTHAVGAIVALPAATLAIAGAPAGVVRFAVAIYTVAATLMVAAATVAVALLGLPPGWQRVVVPVATVLAVVGIVVEWTPRRTPRGFAHGMYLTGGWAMMVGVGELWQGPGPRAVTWLVAGGAAYTVGAVIVALRRPDPWPQVFGYHEVWHVLVLVAVACHWHLVVEVLPPG